MNNTINISNQNLTLAAARSALSGNQDGYFQIVSFYVAGASGNRPDSTGLIIQFDPRLTVLGADEGSVFNSKLYSSDGRPVTAKAKNATEEVLDAENNIFFATTADGSVPTQDYYLYFAAVQFPADVEVGDVFTVEIKNGANDEFLFVDSTASAADQASMNAWSKSHVVNGGFTIIE